MAPPTLKYGHHAGVQFSGTKKHWGLHGLGCRCGPVWDVKRGEVETGVSVTGDGQCMGSGDQDA